MKFDPLMRTLWSYCQPTIEEPDLWDLCDMVVQHENWGESYDRNWEGKDPSWILISYENTWLRNLHFDGYGPKNLFKNRGCGAIYHDNYKHHGCTDKWAHHQRLTCIRWKKTGYTNGKRN